MPNSTSVAYESGRVGFSNPCVLNGLTGFNSKASAQYILLFDAETIPANGAIPIMMILVGPSSNFSIDFGFHGRQFENGVVVCNSSTPATKTLGSADCWFDIQARGAF